jgi:hypothetical protein
VARFSLRLALVAALAALAIPAAAARADGGLLTGLLGGGCGTDAPVFAPWGDYASYYFAPNGGFESGATGWSFARGAGVVGGSESYSVSGAGAYSGYIPTGGSASTTVCYGVLYPDVRFFVKDASAAPATVHVRIVTRSLLGVLSVLDGGTFEVTGDWQPSPKLSTLLSALAAPLGTKSMTLQISVDSGAAQIDDLYVDPFVRIS